MQREALTAWAKRNGVEIVFYQDAGVSGASNSKGPVFRRMMADLEANRLDGVVVTSVDRFGRDELDMLTSYKELTRMGKKLISLKEGDMGIGNDDAAFVRVVLTAAAAKERRDIRRRMAEGYARYRANGGTVGRRPIKFNQADFDKYLKAGATVGVIARLLKINKHTTRNYVRLRRKELGIVSPNSPTKNKQAAEETTEKENAE